VIDAALADRLRLLSSLLIDPLAPHLQDSRRVVVTVPGVLAGLPWTILPGMRSRVVTVAASVSRWIRERERLTAVSTKPAVPTTAGFAAGPRVARGEEEVEAGASAWQSATVLKGPTATVDGVTAIASRVDVLHIAAHGRHASENPLFSGLELADGTLFGYDIDRMAAVPSTVVLSACEVGRSSVRWGEESVGMTRVWLHAGTRCVVAAPVVVADDAACELLAAMHEGLAAGSAPAEALAEASDRTGIVAPFQAYGAGF
jgi:CHAT domain-containing protein